MKTSFKDKSPAPAKPLPANYAVLWVSAHPEAFAAAKSTFQQSKKSTVGVR